MHIVDTVGYCTETASAQRTVRSARSAASRIICEGLQTQANCSHTNRKNTRGEAGFGQHRRRGGSWRYLLVSSMTMNECTRKIKPTHQLQHVHLAPSTTFLTPFGRYRFKRLHMGINIAPEIYKRKMYELLGDVDGVLIYMDDVIVFEKSESEHDDTLKTIVDRIKAAGLKLNKKKCEFEKQSLEFLGQNISHKDTLFPLSLIRLMQ